MSPGNKVCIDEEKSHGPLWTNDVGNSNPDLRRFVSRSSAYRSALCNVAVPYARH